MKSSPMWLIALLGLVGCGGAAEPQVEPTPLRDFDTEQRMVEQSQDPPPQKSQTAIATNRSAGHVTNSIGMKLKLIPAGEFVMGPPESEKIRDTLETQHRVRITKPFYMGIYEVTQAEFQKVLGRNPSLFAASGGYGERVSGQDTSSFPVDHISWYDTVEFCNRLSESENRRPYYALSRIERDKGRIKSADMNIGGGNGYRLPTEAEWEYACRAGTTSPFHFGSQLNGKAANVDGTFPYGTTTKGPFLERTTVVGSYEANAFGLYDMHGNVLEWCQDWYGTDYYVNSPASDPQGPSTGSSRVIRGGSWRFSPRSARSASRNSLTPGNRNEYGAGFRVVLSTE